MTVCSLRSENANQKKSDDNGGDPQLNEAGPEGLPERTRRVRFGLASDNRIFW
jgi:hypothetical protein